MPNVMVALPNIDGVLCSTPLSLADAHVTYQQQERYNEATDGRINFKLGGNCHREVRIT